MDDQAAQAAVAIGLADELRQTLPTVDVVSQWAQLVAYLTHLIQGHGRASATLAVHQYERARRAAGVSSRFTVIPAVPAQLDKVARTAGWALQPILDGHTDLMTPLGDLVSTPLDNLVAASERLALNTGRNTIIDNAQRDKTALGWARVTEPDPCSWCALLATRGAVYKSKASALVRADGKSFHTNDRCHAEPVFTAYEPSAQVRQWQADYRTATRGSKDPLNAWRQAYEGRTNVPGSAG